MLTILTALGRKACAWLLAAVAVLAAVVGVYLRGRSAGKNGEQAKVTERELANERARNETIQEASSAQIEISRLPADDVHQRLRDKWTRSGD